jgi:hypothetical protein
MKIGNGECEMINVITRESVSKELFNLIIEDSCDTSRDDHRKGGSFYTQFIFEINEEYFPENPELWGFWESNAVIRDDYDGWENGDIETLTRVEKKTKTVVTEEWVAVK